MQSLHHSLFSITTPVGSVKGVSGMNQGILSDSLHYIIMFIIEEWLECIHVKLANLALVVMTTQWLTQQSY